ncbi:hypothetical protein [Myceligenerans crystallogenes]|uniref:Uncharacterized protein n=1 Tax=Myceligenerans crystallogenes TaxID=316335 RepID=A0ABN2N1B0_9MICO
MAETSIWIEFIEQYPDLDFWVANNRTIGVAELRRLAVSATWQTRHRVAGKRRTRSGQVPCPPDLLEKLAHDPCDAVVHTVANNPGTPLATLQFLSRHRWDEVQTAAIRQLELFDQWVAALAGEVGSGQSFASGHLDEAGASLWSTESAVQEAITALDAATRVVADIGAQLVVGLALPLEMPLTIDVQAPDLRKLELIDEPPSIYVLSAGHFLLPSDREEYRCPIEHQPWGSGYHVEYVCGRSLKERELGWEFSRTIWVRKVDGAAAR